MILHFSDTLCTEKKILRSSNGIFHPHISQHSRLHHLLHRDIHHHHPSLHHHRLSSLQQPNEWETRNRGDSKKSTMKKVTFLTGRSGRMDHLSSLATSSVKSASFKSITSSASSLIQKISNESSFLWVFIWAS